jgi:uncharacterized protein involved in exopolysaccharide biosynthesis
MSEENKTVTPTQPEEQEIDLLELALKVWKEKKLVLKVCGYAALIGLIVAFSIPRQYTTKVMLAPESQSTSNMGRMGGLASMMGISLGGSMSEDALRPDLYPGIVSSTPFLTELFPVPVKNTKGTLNTTLYEYLDEHQRRPWWSAIISLPFRALKWTLSLFSSKDEKTDTPYKLDPFRLTRDEARIAKAIDESIQVAVDKKTNVTSISVTMQDPLISATVTDTVLYHLQNYITEYRTKKARQDLKFAQKLFNEAEKNYNQAQDKYAKFVDANKNIILQSYRVEQERLQNQVSLYYNTYNQMAQELQVARANIQKITPVYAVVEPATVPLSPSKPRKVMILLGFVFLGGVGCVAWILFGRNIVRKLKEAK